MVRVPNKLYGIQESTLWQMCMIRKAIPQSGILLEELRKRFDDYPIDDFIDALTGLYAINEIELENQIIRSHVTSD